MAMISARFDAALHDLERIESGMQWRFTARRELFPSDLGRRDFLVAVSLRNPRFSNAWLGAVGGSVGRWGGRLHVCLVDEPYFEQAAASVARAAANHLRALAQQRAEQRSRLARFARANLCRLFEWEELRARTPLPLFHEVEAAFAARGRFWRAVMEQTRSKSVQDASGRLADCIFLRREVPVLVNVYHRLLRGTIDVYPGPQAALFWKLEAGHFRRELPICTALAEGDDGLIHASAVFRDDG